MPSRISQMRNALPIQPQMQNQQTRQTQLNESIENVKRIMWQVKNAQDPQAMMVQLLQSNPQVSNLAAMLKNNNIEDIARKMAQTQGIDIEKLISQL